MARKASRRKPCNPAARVAILVALAVPCGVLAGEGGPATSAPDSLAGKWQRVSPERLDGMRGGFELPSGWLVSFGIERVVQVNGQLVASTRLIIANGRVEGDLSAFNQTLLVRVGEGNTFQPTGMGGLVIQNTLDNQDIRVSTRIDAQLGTLGAYQAIRQHDMLQGALAGAVAP
jgi:hypothetical protein